MKKPSKIFNDEALAKANFDALQGHLLEDLFTPEGVQYIIINHTSYISKPEFIDILRSIYNTEIAELEFKKDLKDLLGSD